mgnify:CR=1 FL=1
MNRASPADLRKTLEAANTLTKAGIMFICMPVLDEQQRVVGMVTPSDLLAVLFQASR